MAQCLTPITIKPHGDEIPVPCGKCYNCQMRRVSGWSFRLMQQTKIAHNAYFVTLTYDTDFVPITKNGFMSLTKGPKSCVTKFFKRLRKMLPNNGIKYYYAGEYGTKRMRPHYHIILFNATQEAIIKAWMIDEKPIGSVHFGHVSEASVGYTLKYINKPSKIPLHANDDRVPEFSAMSKGLGINYLTEQMKKWHHADKLNRMYCNLPDGKKISMPRYYKKKLYDDDEITLINDANGKRLIEQQNKRIEEIGHEAYQFEKQQQLQELFRKQKEQFKKRETQQF